MIGNGDAHHAISEEVLTNGKLIDKRRGLRRMAAQSRPFAASRQKTKVFERMKLNRASGHP
jgi:hypothetical protein